MFPKKYYEKKDVNTESDEESYSSDDDYDDELDETNVSSIETKISRTSYKSKVLNKRAHHNALERKRRDLIKEKFQNLKNEVPTIKYLKHSPRIQILAATSSFIEQQNKIKGELDEVLVKKETLKRQLMELQTKYGIDARAISQSSKKRKSVKVEPIWA